MGKKTGPNPTDRGKRGVKRSLLVEAAGIPLALVIDGANCHDMRLLAPTLEALAIRRPTPSAEHPQGLCLDRGYDFAAIRTHLLAGGYTPHIRRRGEERTLRREAGVKARRWVVERTHGWLNRFRRILIRWEKRADTYLAMLHLACGIISYRAAGLTK